MTNDTPAREQDHYEGHSQSPSATILLLAPREQVAYITPFLKKLQSCVLIATPHAVLALSPALALQMYCNLSAAAYAGYRYIDARQKVLTASLSSANERSQ